MKKKIRLPNKIVIASFNKGKLVEIKQLFKNTKVNFIEFSTFTNISPEENGKTFTENALIKARSANKISGLASIADDSGLCINALNGKPGILSSRWAGKNNNFLRAINIIEKKLENEENKTAYFICALALVLNTNQEFTFVGKTHGSLVFPPKGKSGFGYDPIFVPNKQILTFGQMNPEKKDLISHRFKAYKKMKEVFYV